MGAIPCYQIKGPFNPKGQVIILPNVKPAPVVNQNQQGVVIAQNVNLTGPISLPTNPLLTMTQTSTKPIAPKSTVPIITLGQTPAAPKTIRPAGVDTPVGGKSGFVQGQIQAVNQRINTHPLTTIVQGGTNIPVKTIKLPAVNTSVVDTPFANQTIVSQVPLKKLVFSEDKDNVLKRETKCEESLQRKIPWTRNSTETSAVCVVTPDGKVKAISPSEMLTSDGSVLDNSVSSDSSAKNNQALPLAVGDSPISGNEQKILDTEHVKTVHGEMSSKDLIEKERLDAELRKLDSHEKSIVEIVRQLETESEVRNMKVSESVDSGNEQIERPDSIPVTTASFSPPKAESSTYRSPDLEIPAISFSMIADDYDRGGENSVGFERKTSRDVLLTTLLTPKTPKSGAYGYGLGLDVEELFIQTNPQEL